MAQISFSEISDADIGGLQALWERCRLTRPWNDPEADIAFARKSENATILVGRHDHEIVASVMVGHDGHRGTVYYLSVDPDRRGEGLGRQTMAAAETWLHARGVWKLNLIVRAENTAVIDFYRSIGYAVEERVNMAKWLNPDKDPDRATHD